MTAVNGKKNGSEGIVFGGFLSFLSHSSLAGNIRAFGCMVWRHGSSFPTCHREYRITSHKRHTTHVTSMTYFWTNVRKVSSHSSPPHLNRCCEETLLFVSETNDLDCWTQRIVFGWTPSLTNNIKVTLVSSAVFSCFNHRKMTCWLVGAKNWNIDQNQQEKTIWLRLLHRGYTILVSWHATKFTSASASSPR